MKLEAVRADARRRTFHVRTSDAVYVMPWALLRAPPTPENPLVEVFPDEEIGREGFTYRLDDGTEDTVHLDAVLEYNRDPDHLKAILLHRLTVAAREAAATSGLSKRELVRRLGTSASQLYRLLDPTNTTKSIGQMVALLHLLGKKVDLVVSERRSPPTSN